MLVVTAFKSSKIIPWQLKNRCPFCFWVAKKWFFITFLLLKQLSPQEQC
jgi:hypothetical protein